MNSREWTTIGQKKKHIEGRTWSTSKNKAIENTTPGDVYYANTGSRTNKCDMATDNILNAIAHTTKGLSEQERLKVLGNTVEFAINTISTIIYETKSDISNIDDHQKTVITLNTYLENFSETYTTISNAMLKYEENIRSMELMKTIAIENIQKFLVICGISEIPSNTDECNIHVSSILDENKRSYASSIGATLSDLVVETKCVNNNQYKTSMVDTGIVNINIPVISNINDIKEFTISYLDKKMFVISIDGTVFTVGSGDFVDLKNTHDKTKHAKRCLNTQPCQYTYCKYYHDPSIMSSSSNYNRKFALSYVLQILGGVKDNVDILENKMIRNPTFVRDLVQLGGIILIKAAQIKSLYFKGNNI
jgi:hypothetical protein